MTPVREAAPTPPAGVAAAPAPNATPPGLTDLFLGCARLSLLSIGGNVSAMMHTDFVTRRGWVDERAFLDGMALSQTLPGVNIVNLAIWIGYLLRGTGGAMVAFLGTVLPAGIVIVTLASAIRLVQGYALSTQILGGIAAAALGMSLNLASRSARHSLGNLASIAIFATAFAANLMHVSLPAIIAVLGPVSVGISLLEMRDGKA